MTDHILVDANSVSHAAHQGTLLKAGDQETQAIYGMVKFSRVMKVRYPFAKIIYLWDGRSWRKDEDTEYKANRTDDSKKRADRARFKTQAPFIRKALTLLAQPQMFALNLEADDLAGMMAPRLTRQGHFVRLITGDRDWLQLVSPLCVWEDHREETRKVNHSGFQAKTGYPNVTQFVQSKALQGDTSDNLPGVGAIGEKGAADLLSVWGDVRTFLADTDRAGTYKSKRPDAKKLPKAFEDFAKMEDRQKKFFHNMRMMDLAGDIPAPVKLTLNKGVFQPDGFKSLCNELGFHSIAGEKTWGNWIEPFSKGQN